MVISLVVLESNTCSNVIQLDLPQSHAPLYLHKKNEKLILVEPTSGSLEVKNGATLLLSCPGGKNTIVASKNRNIRIACDSQLDFHKAVKGAVCEKSVTGNIQKTTVGCSLGARGGTAYKIGFDGIGFGVKDQFIELFEVCYNYERASALYSHHKINGKAINGALH